MALAQVNTPAYTSTNPLEPPTLPEHAAPWLADLLQWSAAHGVTDIHLYPGEGEAYCWARIDGSLREITRYSPAIHARLVARLKVLGRCADYAGEVFMESRFELPSNAATTNAEVRLSIIPTLRGEKVVLRLTQNGTGLRPLDTLGYAAPLLATLRTALDTPQGLILVTGPSGSGKSTTLYALLADLLARAARPVSILTVEDPIEQSLPGAAQMAADPARGLGFAAAIRALLRQDPEVIMFGEIRDAETASAALQAALTGHRLLSSMHTLSAAEALLRLRQMGAAPYLITSALAGILTCRLIRLACPACRASETPACEQCLNTGHHGRQAIGGWSELTLATINALESNLSTAQLDTTLHHIHTLSNAAEALLSSHKITRNELNTIPGLSPRPA